jgi:valacyclovir hydrolase
VDPRGYGQSRPPDRDFSGDFFLRDAEDVNALAESIGCLEYFLAGWSDGANVAVLVAAQHPARVRKLVLWGGNSDIRPDDVKGLDQTRDLSNWPRRRRLALQAVYGDRLVELWNSYCDGMHHLHLRGGEICGDRLREVRCPTLVIHGEQDPLISEDRARAFQNGITGAEFHLIRGGRHNVHLTHHEEFDEVMLRFLDKTL